MKAIVIAGGFGKRLLPLTESTPKPLLEFKGKPILEHIINHLVKSGIKEIFLCTGYLSEKIEEYFKDGSRFGAKIAYSKEENELGTGGALKLASKYMDPSENFIVLYGDLDIEMDLNKFISFHKTKNSDATLTVHETDHPQDSDLIKLDNSGKVIKFFLKNQPRDLKETGNIGNAGIYCFNSSIFHFFPDGKCGLDKDVLPNALGKGAKIYGYRTSEKVNDVGTHDRYRSHK